MGMEYAAGLSYRVLRPLLGAVPFHVYLAGFIALWSSLSIVAAFLAGKALWGSSGAGLLAAAALAATPASFARTPGNFLREDFTLPFLFASFALTLEALRRAGNGLSGARPRAAAASAALAIGVATWHLSRFYVLVLLLITAVAVVAAGARAPADDDRRPAALSRLLAALVAGLAIAGLLVPVLREKRFLLSPALLVGLSILAVVQWTSWRASRGSPPGRRALAAALCAACAAGFLLARALPGAEREYSHTTGLLIEKVRFLGQKPSDPSLLSDDARVFWVGPFATPAAATILLTFSTMLLWGPLALAASVRDAVRGRLEAGRLLAFLAAAVFAGAALLVERLGVFLVFFAALLLPGVPLAAGPSRRRAVWVLLSALGLFELAALRSPSQSSAWRDWVTKHFPDPPAESVPNLGNNGRVVAWIRRHVPESAVVLTWFPAGPMVLTDTGRPINLHSMFESRALRAKERRMREALYGSEEDLRSLCDEWKSDYLLYQANLLLDTSTESYRYMADRLRLPATSVAVALHFFPERLRHFALVYQDSYYRLFRVARGEGRGPEEGDPGGGDARSERDADPGEAARRLPYEEIFDPSPLGALGDAYPDELTERVLARQSARLTGAERGIAARASGDARAAEALFRRVLSASRDAVEAEIPLAMLLIEEGRLGEADSLVERSLSTRPEYAELRYVRGLVLERSGRRDEAIAAFREALAISPGAAPARERLRALGAD